MILEYKQSQRGTKFLGETGKPCFIKILPCPPEGVFQLFDALQTVLESGLIGLGMQRAASRIKLVTMLIVRLGGAYVSCQKLEVFIVKMQRTELIQH